jgi:hypothetical protein
VENTWVNGKNAHIARADWAKVQHGATPKKKMFGNTSLHITDVLK